MRLKIRRIDVDGKNITRYSINFEKTKSNFGTIDERSEIKIESMNVKFRDEIILKFNVYFLSKKAFSVLDFIRLLFSAKMKWKESINLSL